jgi:hypothetical protein
MHEHRILVDAIDRARGVVPNRLRAFPSGENTLNLAAVAQAPRLRAQ